MSHRTFSSIVLVAMCLLGVGLVYAIAQEEQIDWKKARQLHERFVRGEKLSSRMASWRPLESVPRSLAGH